MIKTARYHSSPARAVSTGMLRTSENGAGECRAALGKGRGRADEALRDEPGLLRHRGRVRVDRQPSPGRVCH
jgi:hypothetical protein